MNEHRGALLLNLAHVLLLAVVVLEVHHQEKTVVLLEDTKDTELVPVLLAQAATSAAHAVTSVLAVLQAAAEVAVARILVPTSIRLAS
jgi:hypothetical protein